MNGIALLEKGEGRELLKKLCRLHDLPVSLIERLVVAELEQVGKKTKRGIRERFDEILDEYVTDVTEKK